MPLRTTNLRSDGIATRKKILSAAVRLFLEKGYRAATTRDIMEAADVNVSSLRHFFGGKDGILLELEHFMYENQFSVAQGITGKDLSAEYVYALETAIQLTLTELNENIRECYLETYTNFETLDYVQQMTAPRLLAAFGKYQPELTEHDFYVMDFGSAGLMRGYMANRCTEDFTLEQKLQAFLTQALRGFKVPEEEVQKIVSFVIGLDIRSISLKVMEQLFRELAMHYEFSLDGILPEAETGGEG